jgi:glutaredoxin
VRYDVYGIDGCQYCSKAVELLKKQGVQYNYTKINDVEKKAFLDGMNAIDGDTSRTFPRIYIVGDNHLEAYLLGGYTELENHMIFG